MRKKLAAQISAATTAVMTPLVALAAQAPPNVNVAGGNANIKSIATTIINFLLILAGALAVIFLIVGGIRYLISAGDSGQIEKAKHTIQYAIIGLIIIIFSYAIVNALINNLAH